MTKEINEEVREEFYNLILRAACGNKKRADALRDKLDKANIKCIADFESTHLLTMRRINGIGKVYGAILSEMWRIRLMEIVVEAVQYSKRKSKEEPA